MSSPDSMVNLQSQFGGPSGELDKLEIPSEVAIKSPRDFGVRFFNALSRNNVVDTHNRSSGLSNYKDVQEPEPYQGVCNF